MSSQPVSYSELEDLIRRWTEIHTDIRAAVIVGSRARRQHLADAYSDLDLILFTTNQDGYAATSRWLEQIADVWIAALGRTGAGDPEWIALYEGGFKVDFVLASSPARVPLSQLVVKSPYAPVFRRGMRVLQDATGGPALEEQSWQALEAPAPPGQYEFELAINRALIAASRTVAFIRRGDLWRAKRLCDCELKTHLLQLLQWQAQVSEGARLDTWYDGRYLANWADPLALEALSQTFASFTEASLRQALRATIDLMGGLAQEVAEGYGYAFPSAGQARALRWLQESAES